MHDVYKKSDLWVRILTNNKKIYSRRGPEQIRKPGHSERERSGSRGYWGINAGCTLINGGEPLIVEMFGQFNHGYYLCHSDWVWNSGKISSEKERRSWPIVSIIALINNGIIKIVGCSNYPLYRIYCNEQISFEELSIGGKSSICEMIRNLLTLYNHINRAIWIWKRKGELKAFCCSWKWWSRSTGSLSSKKPVSCKLSHVQ